MKSKIIGSGSYVPKKIVTNDDLSQTLETNDEWINSRTGIKERRIADVKGGESASFMAVAAALSALKKANVAPQDLDLIIVSTLTGDYRLPSTACLVQEKLKAHKAAAFDISAACAGSIYGLSIADSFIASGKYQKVLLVCVEVMSSIINWEDRNTAVLFGDGASAALLSCSLKNECSGFLDIELYADGSQHKTVWMQAGGSLDPVTHQAIDEKRDKVCMNGRETYKFAIRSLSNAIENILAKHSLTKDHISFIAPHQANLRIIEALSERVGVPIDRFLVNLDKYANTSSASLLLAYDEAEDKKLFNKEDLILMLAIGGGFVWGAGLYRY